MRVIIASSVDSPEGLKLTNIDPDATEPYAILSHTWGAEEDEVVYADILEGKARSRLTYETKVAFTCRLAIADGYKYVWIDACCIDKSSSAELSEAINSMFQWYRKSAVCYAFFSDVPSTTKINETDSAFARARWFTRGFTLQELLAPPNVIFYSKDWISLGTKASLSNTLATITKVDIEVLIGDCPIEATSIANRMGWAANRVTKRPEDIAYCLMGIFSVNMPLLYGEGSKAFIRLQEEIMKSSTDHSLFAWIDESAPEDELKGVLAQSPSMFSKTSAVSPFTRWGKQEPYFMTNMGLSIQLPVNEMRDFKGIRVACFHCPTPETPHETFFGIFLKALDTAKDNMRFARVRAAQYYPVNVYQYSGKMDVYLDIHPSPQNVTAVPVPLFSRPLIRFENRPWWSAYELVSLTVYPGGQTYFHNQGSTLGHWPLSKIYLRQGKKQISCAVLIKNAKDERFLILLGTWDDATIPAYHVVDMQEDLRKSDYSPDQIPNLHELELFYHRPKLLGEMFQFGATQVHLAQTKQNGREHNIQVNVRRIADKMGKVGAPKKGDVEPESSSSNLRKQLSRMKLHR